jgi:hypothetical protein
MEFCICFGVSSALKLYHTNKNIDILINIHLFNDIHVGFRLKCFIENNCSDTGKIREFKENSKILTKIDTVVMGIVMTTA